MGMKRKGNEQYFRGLLFIISVVKGGSNLKS